MRSPFIIQSERADSMLREAAAAHLPATLSCKEHSGAWANLKCRLAGVDETGTGLLIELPDVAGENPPSLSPGQHVSVSFRRGSHKCVFNTSVDGAVEVGRRPRAGLRLHWPDGIHELQRRLYHRTAVPAGAVLAVDVSRFRDDSPQRGLARRGRLVDISAGGMSLDWPQEAALTLREEEPLLCRLAGDCGTIEVTGCLRHQSPTADGQVRIGVQFTGLESSDEGRRTLSRISKLAGSLRYAAPSR